MGQRLELQMILEKTILGAKRVYFQPPESVKLEYPAIVYELDYIKSQHADNLPYTKKKRYSITIITKDPDNEYIDKMMELSTCSFERSFTQNNLYHYVFELYF